MVRKPPTSATVTFLTAVTFALPASSIAAAPAAAFQPNKPVTLIVPYGAGGGTDAVGRLFAQKLAELWNQPVVVENRAGANGVIGSAFVAKAAPDGYTLLLSVASIAINPYMMPKLPYDTATAFTPITSLALPVVVMVASPKIEAKDVPTFVGAARQQPGKFTFASTETSTQLYGERLKEEQHFAMVHVPYKGSTQWMTDLMAGNVDTGFSSVTSALPFLKDGKLKVLGVASARRSRLLPDVPTFSEQGIADMESRSWYGLFGPGNMPPATVQAIHQDVKRVLASADVIEKLQFLGAEPGGEAPAQFAKRFQADLAEYGVLIKRLNLTGQ
ncbi:tripartite tricarboxylate transporter substrate binding protein [Cupriavidus alkaliphilus]|uniref:Tripartite-type tricarboxylate transporter receptor subunit TctC n=1 Tax=Cupriavidus alkaliphilus TaxID=942866 RepID=A0A7W4YSL6_9BURK|nr:tripartite tricarboxylate transporter substrate binding protein [Cupriavidus alkaliphilus]MBB3009960.1 tripartite-type tricarboxylate transporter receptor subunit TctC [Cupriavidus alkaliphilus]